MEYEIVEWPLDSDPGGDSRIVHELRAAKDRNTVDAQDYPERRDQALLIPDEEPC